MVDLKPPEQTPEPPELRPPDIDQPVQQKSNLFFILLLVVTLFLLLDLAILAYWLWPERGQLSDESRTEVEVVEETTPPVPEQAAVTVPSSGQLKAEESLALWLRRQAEARGFNIENWGGREYGQALAAGAEGDQHMAAGDYDAAADAYQRATDRLAGLVEGKADLLSSLLEQGGKALEALDGDRAKAVFERALAIDARNRQAREGIERATTLDKVAGLLESAEGLETEGDLAGAVEKLQQAKDLDPLFIPAKTALQRVQEKIEEQKLAQAMGRFYTHLREGSHAAAGAALVEAAALRPGDPVIAEARYQLKSAREAQQLSSLSVTYRKLSEDEQWQAALETADQALKIDPEAGFAVRGKLESSERLTLDGRLQRIIKNPLRLQDDGPYAEAVAVLKEARVIPTGGKRLQQQITVIDRLLTEARLEVRVGLRSDGFTEVVIYRVGPLGRFIEKTVELRPGRYTVVGTRPGFRNIRRILEVAPAARQPEFVIQCEEPI